MRFNGVILWNNQPPVNARDVVECAHSWGISVLWGFAWGWSTNCRVHFPFALLAEMFWSADEPYEVLVERVMRRVLVAP